MSFLLETKNGGKLEVDNTSKYLANVLKAMVDIDGVGQKKVTELWNSSRLQLTQFMSQEDVSKFMNTHVSYEQKFDNVWTRVRRVQCVTA